MDEGGGVQESETWSLGKMSPNQRAKISALGEKASPPQAERPANKPQTPGPAQAGVSVQGDAAHLRNLQHQMPCKATFLCCSASDEVQGSGTEEQMPGPA